FFIALDPARLLDAGEYDRRMADFRDRIKTTAPFNAGGEVLLPGEIEMRHLAERRAKGIPVPAKTLAEVRALAKSA
ncbi:MAG: Ldh family oxidoreductase, partial [Parvibaculum sp.]